MKRFYVCAILSAVMLSGCSSMLKDDSFSEDIILEAAVNAAGYSLDEVEDEQIQKDGDSYIVTFTNEKGSYTLKVSNSGSILSYSFSNGDSSSEDSGKDSEDEAKESEANQETQEDAKKDDTEKESAKSEENSVLPDNSLSEAQLLSILQAHLGLGSLTSQEVTFTASGQEWVYARVAMDGYTCVVEINPISGEVLSTGYE